MFCFPLNNSSALGNEVPMVFTANNKFDVDKDHDIIQITSARSKGYESQKNEVNGARRIIMNSSWNGGSFVCVFSHDYMLLDRKIFFVA